MSTIASSYVTVFPSAKRSLTQPQSRLVSEASLVSIVNKLVNSEGFIVSSESAITDANPLEFNIFGYYFKITSPYTALGLASLTTTDVYAHIEIVTTGTGENAYAELYGQDSSDMYTGLVIDQSSSYTPQQSGVVKSLKIAEYSSNAWQVPASSRLKFTNASIDITEIDGGIIT